MIVRTARRQLHRNNLHRNNLHRKNLHRRNLLWLAALLHRLSGVGLAVFLPVHFLTLGLAIDGEARLESFLRWSDAPAVKFGEAMLMFLLAVHALGGLRLLALENLDWHDGQRRNAAMAAGFAGVVAVVFLAWVL
jgi:fumarate reductase subunit D